MRILVGTVTGILVLLLATGCELFKDQASEKDQAKEALMEALEDSKKSTLEIANAETAVKEDMKSDSSEDAMDSAEADTSASETVVTDSETESEDKKESEDKSAEAE